MYFLKSIIDICIIIFLIRLLISSRESYFNPIYRIIYRITDTLLMPSRYLIRDDTKGVFINICALVVIRGLVYISIRPMPFISGVGISLLNFFQLLFRGYMVLLIIDVLSQDGIGTILMDITKRAFYPLNKISRRFGVSRRYFHLFSFLFLWVLYALSSFLISNAIISKTSTYSFSLLHGLGEGMMLILGLFPNFFSIVIIIGALLSWVSPDPYNPVVQAIYGISEPLLRPFRRFVPLLGGLDISPIFALLCFQILGRLGQQLISGFMRIV